LIAFGWFASGRAAGIGMRCIPHAQVAIYVRSMVLATRVLYDCPCRLYLANFGVRAYLQHEVLHLPCMGVNRVLARRGHLQADESL
jgi:hypothetical protein